MTRISHTRSLKTSGHTIATGRTQNDNGPKKDAMNQPPGKDLLDIHPVQLEIWRGQEPSQRLELAMQLSRELVEGNYRELRRLYPLESERQLRRRFTRLNYGHELAEAVYGED